VGGTGADWYRGSAPPTCLFSSPRANKNAQRRARRVQRSARQPGPAPGGPRPAPSRQRVARWSIRFRAIRLRARKPHAGGASVGGSVVRASLCWEPLKLDAARLECFPVRRWGRTLDPQAAPPEAGRPLPQSLRPAPGDPRSTVTGAEVIRGRGASPDPSPPSRNRRRRRDYCLLRLAAVRGGLGV
jgi:hypothetical protein